MLQRARYRSGYMAKLGTIARTGSFFHSSSRVEAMACSALVAWPKTAKGVASVQSAARHWLFLFLLWVLERTGEKFCGGCGLALTPADRPPDSTSRAPHTYTPSYLADKILTLKSALEGERKQVTVLFADLKDSTELIRGLDPEAAQRLLDPALQRMMDAVHRFEGTVNQVLGDGIMALFGAPIAHEDHALRACYAALAMQAAMRLYRGGAPRPRPGDAYPGGAQLRRGGGARHRQRPAHGLFRRGETTHLAARMEQLATPAASVSRPRPCVWWRAWCRSMAWDLCQSRD